MGVQRRAKSSERQTSGEVELWPEGGLGLDRGWRMWSWAEKAAHPPAQVQESNTEGVPGRGATE